MSANDYLLDAGIKHQIYVQRYAGGQVKDLVKYLDDAQAEILRKLDGVDSLAESRSLQRKLDQITALQSDALEKLSKGITDNAADFAEYEAEFAVKTMNTAAAASVTLPASEQLRALVTQAPMQLAISGKAGSTVQSLTLGQAATQFSKDKAAEITRTIQRGMVEGSTVQSLTRQIASVTNKHKRQAEALVRTSVNHISSEARSAVNRANDDILKGEEYVSVLDGRTTIGCAALDGKILGFDEPPFTPRHWNCRSLRVPVLQDRFQEEGLDGTRASMDGPVSAKRTYSGWLKGQSKEFRVQVLGKERAALFDAGKLSLDDFVDANGNPISLKQLQVLDGATNVRKTPKVVIKPTPGTGKIPGQAKKFVPAKTIKEAEKFAIDNDLARVAKFGKLDVAIANEMNQSMLENIERMPALKGRMSFIGSAQENGRLWNAANYNYTLDQVEKIYPGMNEFDQQRIAKRNAKKTKTSGNTYAFARDKNKGQAAEFFKDVDGIAYNEAWGKKASVDKFKAALARDVENGWHPVGTENLRSVMDHEIGHQIDYMLGLSKNPELIKLFRENRENMREVLSAYANKNIAEFIAESWGEYINNPTPRPLAKQIGDLMNAEYAKQFKDFGS
jgi:SPP1 gp7 family putative phage head morphogenesis protein